jgi:hypothetical protein
MNINKGSHEFLLPKNESRTSSNKPAMQDFLEHWVECACNKSGVQNTEENFIILFKFVCKKKSKIKIFFLLFQLP